MSDSTRSHKEEQVRGYIERILGGDREAFRGIYDLYLRDVRQILFAFLGPHEDMDDLVQMTFLELYRSLGNFEGRSRFSTWLYRLTMNVAMQHLRKRGRRAQEVELTDLIELADPLESPEKTAEKRQLVGLVHKILDGIAERKREVFLLHEVQGMSPQEIAEVVGSSVHTVKSRLFHARKEFYERWDKAMRRDETSIAFLLGRGSPGDEARLRPVEAPAR